MTAALTEAEEVLPRLYALRGAAAEAMADADAGHSSTSAAISRALRGEAFCGLPSAQRAALRCEWHVNQLMPARGCMSYGLPTDERADFFIVRSDTRRASQQARQKTSGERRSSSSSGRTVRTILMAPCRTRAARTAACVDAYVVDLQRCPRRWRRGQCRAPPIEPAVRHAQAEGTHG